MFHVKHLVLRSMNLGNLLVFSLFGVGLVMAQSTQSDVTEFDISKPFETSLKLNPESEQTAQLIFDPNQKRLLVQVDNKQQQSLELEILDDNSLTVPYPPIRIADYTFDGWLDIAIPSAIGYGGVNYFYLIYAFDVLDSSFKKTTFADNEAVCNPELETKTKTLKTSCKSGPAWYESDFRFLLGQPYLYKDGHMIIIEGLEESDILWQIFSYDANGQVIDRQITDYSSDSILRKVELERLYIYEKPTDYNLTDYYLNYGDEVKVLDVLLEDPDNTWVKVAFTNHQSKEILGWVKVYVYQP